jgi:tetratricopeptide (TPR) repeat protein
MQAFLAERLDRLGHSRHLVQVASVIGLMFDSTVLAHVMLRPRSEIERSLDAVARSGVVLRVDTHQYVFRHALLREAAYQMLSRERRRDYHRAIAEVLLRADVAASRAHSEVLAYHFTGAGDARQAALHWLAAGREATARHAMLEAMDAFRKGLDCSAKLPASRENDALEVDLLSGLGFTCIATQGFSAPEVETIFTKARDLCAVAGDAPPMRILFGIWAVYIVRGDPSPVMELAQQLRQIAESSEACADERFIAHACIGTLTFYLGDTSAARYHCERGMALCERDAPGQNQRLIATYGYDGLLFSHLFLAWNTLHCGDPESAEALLSDALALAEQVNSPFCSAMVAAFAATIARDLRKPELARKHGQRAIALAVEYGYPFWLAAGLFAAGWAESELGDQVAALAQIEQGVAVYSQIGARISKPYYLSYLVEVYLCQGRLDEADRVADEALEIAAATVGRHYEPELLRLKAEIAHRQLRHADAEAWCSRALSKATALGLSYMERRIEQTMRDRDATGVT